MLILFLFIWLAMMALAVGALVFWIYVILEVVRYPEPVWAMSRQDKTVWILVVVLVGWLGAIIYWFVAREPLKNAEHQLRATGWQPGYLPPGTPTYPAPAPPPHWGAPPPPPQAPPTPPGPPPPPPPA